MKDIRIFEVDGVRTLPVTLMHGRVINKLPAFGSGKIQPEYVEPVIDPQPFDFSENILNWASTNPDFAIHALNAWSHHTFQVAYYLQFRSDPDGEACKRVHEHTKLVSAILTRRLAIDDSQLWEAFRWLINFKLAQEGYWNDPQRDANYAVHAERLDKANENNASRAEVGHLLERAATRITLMKGEWAKLPPIKTTPASEAAPKAKRMTSAVTVFCSYCHRDDKLRAKLESHLSPLKREGAISLWHDHCIRAGSDWKGQIDDNLRSANLILLLVSADFVASDYCYDIEMGEAMRRHDNGDAIVIPVILRPCDWTRTPFAKLKAKPLDGKPVTSWRKQDEAFLDVAKAIRECVDEKKSNSATVSKPARSQQWIDDSYATAKRLLSSMLRLEKSIRTYRLGFWKDELAQLDEINSIGTEVDEAFHEGHVLWGDEFYELKRNLKDCVGDFRLAWSKSNHARSERVSDAKREQYWQETRPFLHARDENDHFADRIRDAIKAIENELAPHLGRG